MTNPTLSHLPFTEDVQDIVYLAKKLARKDKVATPLDRHFLQAVIQVSRLFTLPDALFKAVGVQPKELKQLYQQEKEGYPNSTGTVTVLPVAENLAQQEGLTEAKKRVELTHLLFALLQSPDPLVQAVFQKAKFTSAELSDAVPVVKEASAQRMALYIIRETLEVVIVVLFMIMVIRQGLGEFRLIPSESMLPTLHIGDRIVVERVTRWFRQPQRRDILVFYPPEPQSVLYYDPWSVFMRLTGFSGLIQNKDNAIDIAYIKRLIGLPGETIEIKPNVGVYINGQLLKEPYINEIPDSCGEECGPIKIPPHMYFMMGDNRNHSLDSRYWAFLPEDRIIGRAVFRFWPLDKRFGRL